MLRIFVTHKNPPSSAGLEPATMGAFGPVAGIGFKEIGCEIVDWFQWICQLMLGVAGQDCGCISHHQTYGRGESGCSQMVTR
jgi:hypothetical protein